MTLALTPDMLAGAYEYLRTTPPFRGWKMPPSDDIEFRVVSDRDCYGYYQPIKGGHVIALSARSLGYTVSVMQTMAHEMIHLHQTLRKIRDSDSHGPKFLKFAKRVCKVHGFDPKVFS